MEAFHDDPDEFATLGLDVTLDFAGIETTRTAIAALCAGHASGRLVAVRD